MPPELATIIPLILTSDKTHLAFSGKVKGWPLLLSIENIANDVCFVPGQHYAQLIAILPIIKGSISTVVKSDKIGVETHESPMNSGSRVEVFVMLSFEK